MNDIGLSMRTAHLMAYLILISSKIAKHVDVIKLFASIALRPVSPEQLLHYDVTTHSCETLVHALVMW